MAEAFVITCLGKIGETVLGKVGDCLVAPIQRQFKYMCCFDSNITELEAQLETLQRTREGVQLRVNNDRANVRIIDPNVEAWLKNANEVTSEVEGITQEKPKVKEGCLKGRCPNLKLRYSLSRNAVKKTEVVVKLQATGVSYTQPSYSPTTTSLESIPAGNFNGFESRRLVMEEIIKALKHDGINLIGVCGMAGVGKTTMVNEVAKRAKEDAQQKKMKAEEDNHFDEVTMAKVNEVAMAKVKEVAKIAKEDNHFDEVAMAVVGQEPNLITVQACIADMLGLKLGDRDNPIVRADLLCNRLLQDNKKILVILDDIWADFDLQRMGIPLGGDNKNLKVLYTSRIKDLWHDQRTRKEIHLELLSEDEAWQLFKEKVGDSADAPDLQSIAKQIVKECGRLPLVLVLIGSALSKTKGNHIKEKWEDMLYQLNCSSMNKDLSELLETSYKYLEHKEAKRLFLLCCLFKEDESIRIEDLVRYAFGLSIFDGIYEITRARHRVLALVDDLKSRYLLQESKDINYLAECVKVHDVVRNMGISIASRDEGALVSHGALSKRPRKDTYEHYTSISVTSENVKELPEGLTYSNLELLLLQCINLEKLPCHFFEGMGKLKVLVLQNFQGILTFQPLKNLTALSLEGFCGMLDNVRVIGDLQNLEILSFRNSKIRELPEEIGELKNLKSLDLEGTYSLNRIPRGVVSRLDSLEELYAMRSSFDKWVGEGEENANLREFESLSRLNTLEIYISGDMPIPRAPIFGELKMYKVFVGCTFEEFFWLEPYKRLLSVVSRNSRSTPIRSDPFISLLRNSDCLVLEGEGCNDLVRELLLRDEDDGLQQLKGLGIFSCDTPESLANTINLFPILKYLFLGSLSCLREICRSPFQMGSFRELTELHVTKCGLFENLFELPIGGCFAQLKFLTITSCIMMKEVFRKQQREDVPDATKRIEFPKLETLDLEDLPSLIGFCGGIDQIDVPKLKSMNLNSLGKFKSLFHNNNNLSSNSSQEDNFGFLSLFPQKVSLADPTGSFREITELNVENCELLENLFELPVGACFAQLKILTIKSCIMMKEVFRKQQREDVPNATKRIEFPKLETLELEDLPSLVGFCRGIDQIDFPKLKRMDLKSLGKFKRRFHNNSNLSSNSSEEDNFGFLSLFPQKVSLPNLELLKISKLENQERPGHYLLSIGFKYIRTLEIEGCHSLRYVFAPTVMKSIPHLRELKIKGCEMLSRIVAEENGTGESSVDEVEFPQLEKLELWDLPSLVSFCRGINQIKFPKLENMHLRSVGKFKRLINNNSNLSSNSEQKDNFGFLSLFPHKVAIPSLKYLELNGLKNVSDLWCSELPSSSFSKLEKLKVIGCTSLRNMFHPSMAKGFVNLKELLIHFCSTLEAVVGKEEEIEGGHERKIDKVEFPQLERLELHDLPNLVSLFPNVNIDLPKSTDRLPNQMQPQSLFNEKVAIPRLKYLELVGLKNVSDLGCSELPRSSFSILKKLDVINCTSLRNIFHLSMAGGLVNLKKLLIKDCSTLEAVFGKEEEVEGGHERKIVKVEFPQLESLELYELPNLVSLYPNVNTALPKSTNRLYNPMQPQSLFNEKVAIPSLKYLKLLGLNNVSDLWCSELPSSSFSKLEKLEVIGCASLRNMFHPSMSRGLVNLEELLIEVCSSLELVVSKEEEVVGGGHGSKIDKTLFPLLGQLRLGGLPNLKRFCNSTHPLEFPKLSQMNILFCPSMDAFSSEPVCAPNLTLPGISWNGDLNNATQFLQKNGNDPMARSMEKPRTFDDVTDKFKPWQAAKTQCRLVAIQNSTDGAHKVVRLIYTNSGDRILALGCNGIIRLWKWGRGQHNPSGMATASVVPQQWQPASGLAMTNDVTGELEEAVPCIALSKNDSYVISACGSVISLFNMMTFRVMTTLMPPPPASTFLAFNPRDNNIIAVGMEDSTIRIYNVRIDEVLVIPKGHQKPITGLAFSTNLEILVSSGADAQLCAWSSYTWSNLKSVPMQLPDGKARNNNTRVQFHSDQIRLLVSHETQLAIYDASKMDQIRQWVPQDVLPAPISSATYSCDSQLVYTSFCDGHIGLFDADSLTLRCYIEPSVYLSPALSSGSQAVYPLVVAAHPQQHNQFAIGLTDGSVIVMELPTITGLDGATASSSNASNQTPDPVLDEDALITTRTRTRTATADTHEDEKDLEEVLDEDALITTRTRTRIATAGTHDDKEDLEEKRKKEEEEEEEERKKKKGKAPLLDEDKEY